ncbi:hypothetical protein BDN71DRAFT_1437368 [Pleurotus eryngii]|uniref:FHA domain-containing protein n=1 Tax=Pleurotus eryngii TaxID=5323 RepID=A0A9P5ZEE7_PLEER|nr:hypothetical protein BDN71DRAFT_1437368 [Pleurotus eryngii]
MSSQAEIWEESGKDAKSSNGTFINGERLSPEGVESDPWELKSDDIVIAHRSEQRQQQQHHQQALQPHGASPSLQAGTSSSTINNSSFNFGANNGSGPPRRTSSGMQPGFAGMSGMGGGMRAPGKSGLTFGHILNRLQGELQKSCEAGTELQSLNGTMSEVHDTLGGSLPSNLPPYPHTLTPVRPLQPSDVPASEPEPEVHPAIPPTALSDLRTSSIRLKRPSPPMSTKFGNWRAYSRSKNLSNEIIVAVVPHELATVAEEDEEQEKEKEAGQSREQETSQPCAEKVRDMEEAEDAESLGMGADHFTDAKHPPQYAQSAELLEALISRLLLLSNQFESFMTLTTSLQAQHDAAKSDTEKATLEQLMTDWKKNVDGQWSSMREEWSDGPGWPRRAKNWRQ